MNTRTRPRRVVLAYSGGLNGSVAVPWLAEAHQADIVTITLDLGQHGELEEVRDRALAIGAVRAHVLDAREEFARDYVARTLKADALADDRWPLVGALAGPIVAKKLVEIAGIEQAVLVAHGVADTAAALRIETAVRGLNPQLTVLAPARDWEMSRLDTIAYAQERNIPVPVTVDTPHSADANLWGRAIACGTIDAWDEPPEELFTLTKAAAACPGEPAYLDIAFERGVPTAVNGVSMPLTELIGTVEMIAGSHGVGRLDVAGSRVREVGEAPAAVVLHAAHAELQRLVTTKDTARFSHRVSREYADMVERGGWFSPLRDALDAYVDKVQERVTGAIRLKLYKGDARIIGRKPAEPKSSTRRLRVVPAKTH
ncbi:MAG TPA: argininosuccinate synthase [Vicinamibacterales bacterium]|jgi:argininosuccinate synthase|nr:argininosuccinate synthase [Vicinamibacterales bacterium]